MSQHDMNLANAQGAAFRSDANNALAALVSNSSGATEPATPFAHQFWADTTSGLLKQRNAANTGWVVIPSISSTQTEMESGEESTIRTMSPLMVKQAISAQTVAMASQTIQVNPSTLTENMTIASGYNAISGGPLTIGEGVNVTVNDNANWTII